MLAFAAIPLLYIRFRRTRRLNAFIPQLPFALDLIKSSLEAGSSLSRSLQSVVQEFGDPLGSEFRTVLEQTRIGLPLPRALEGLLKRVPEEDLRLLVVAVRVHDEIGTSLALIVGRLAEIVRMRQRLRLQIKALTAQSRMGGVIIALLPVLVLGAFSLIQPGYAGSLFSDPAGLRILKFADGPRRDGLHHHSPDAPAELLVMSPLFVSLCVFCLMGASGVAVYAAFYGGNRIVEDRLNDLAVKIRAAQGVFADSRTHR